jgi:hypothetical protein
VLVVGTAIAENLANSLEATSLRIPETTFDEFWSQGSDLESWRNRSSRGEQYECVLVALDASQETPLSIDDVGFDSWLAQCETPFAQWFVALSVACQRCNDGGRVIAFVARPRPMDSGGWSLAACVADGVETMARSFGFIANERDVRMDVITLPLGDQPWIVADVVRDRIAMLSGSNIGSLVVHEGER